MVFNGCFSNGPGKLDPVILRLSCLHQFLRLSCLYQFLRLSCPLEFNLKFNPSGLLLIRLSNDVIERRHRLACYTRPTTRFEAHHQSRARFLEIGRVHRYRLEDCKRVLRSEIMKSEVAVVHSIRPTFHVFLISSPSTRRST